MHRVVNLRHGAEKRHRLVHRHVQHVGDVHALVGDVQGLAVVTLAVAGFARHIDRRQEVHLDLHHAVALAFLAAAALDVEAEPARLVAANFGRRQLGEQIADVVEHARVGGRIAAGRPADGRLVNHNDLVQILEAPEGAMLAGLFLGAVKFAEERAAQDVVHQRAFARAAHAGDAGERAQRNPHVHILQVVFLRAQDFQPAAVLRTGLIRFLGTGNRQLAPQILRGQRFGALQDFRQRARRHQFAAMHPRARSQVQNVIRRAGWCPRHARPPARCCPGRADP